MKKWMIAVSLVVTGASQPAFSEGLDGAKILEMEAEKARQIEDLEYQAKLIEQKAKLAKAYKQLKESGGVIPGEGFEEFESAEREGAKPSAAVAKPAGAEKLSKLPTLKYITNGQAIFAYKGKLLRGVAGSHLPDGFKVVSVSETNGVRLSHGKSIYSLDIAWTSAND